MKNGDSRISKYISNRFVRYDVFCNCNYNSCFHDIVTELYKFPSTQVKDSSVFTNIVVDMKDNDGQNIFAYISDTAAYKLIVYDYKNDDSWVINQANFYPYPTHSNYIVNGVKFTSMDGVLGLALGNDFFFL